MTTHRTIPNAVFSSDNHLGQLDAIEHIVISQMRRLTQEHGQKRRPYTLTLLFDGTAVSVFAGYPAGKVDE